MDLCSVAVGYDNKVLLCATAGGAVRSYKYPLTLNTDWCEHPAHGDKITQVR